MSRLLNFTLTALLVWLILPAPEAVAQSGEPPREPILRIETGMHTAGIRRIGVDRAGKFLVTASEDKTARLWEIATGRLLRVLRVPVGDGNEGRLYAAAISPDGNTIALGGHMTNEVGNVEQVYLFDRESGKVMRRLTGLPNIINHLAFSPDGTLLAAALGSKNGVCVWRTSDWTEVGRDVAYGDDSYSTDFDRAGRLVTSSFDGYLRLYDRQMRLLVKRAPPGGKQPYIVRFSPTEKKLAVGYVDSTKVDVLSADTLAPLYGADTTGVTHQNIASVAWSIDGTMLYAGGRFNDKVSSYPIRRWNDAGRGRYVDTFAAINTVMDIAPLPSGGVVYGAVTPAWGVLDRSHKPAHVHTGQIADYRALLADFLTDSTGRTISFAYEYGGKPSAVFRLDDRTLAIDQTPGSALRSPITEANGLSITDWEDTYAPLLNKAPLKLLPYETSRSLAIAPDGQRFLLGTEYYIRLYDRAGQPVWTIPSPGVAWSVNISADNRIALAAYADGTIRWYRMTDGHELLTFYPHADRKRWVLWTPSGYYDAAPGAEDMIGWHVNNGRDTAADFFPVGQFRGTFYRPDVVAKVLRTGDEALALKEANAEAGRKQQAANLKQMLPPVVEIISPSDGTELSAGEVTVRYSIRTPSGEPVTEVKALVDGRPVASGRGLGLPAAGQSGGDTVRELRIAVPSGESQVSIIAANRFTSSVAATVRVRARRRTVASAAVGGFNSTEGAQFEIRPKLYVLSIGVSNYADPKLRLGFAAKDARDFAASWERQGGDLYREVVVKVLTDELATKDEVLDGLDWIRKETTSKDVAVVLFAGHGVNDPNGQYYFLPFNANTDKLLRTGVSFSDIKNTVSALAGKTLFFIDTCHSGNVLGGTRRGVLAALGELNGVVNELASAENGAVVFAASSGNQFSLENPTWNNGAFTKAVVEGLGGGADYDKSGKGRITLNMLDLYISERVKELTRGQQTPTTAKPQTVPDFLIALKK